MKAVIDMCPSIRLVPTAAPAAFPTHCWHCVFEAPCERGRTLVKLMAATGTFKWLQLPSFQESQGVRASPGPPFTTVALAEAAEEYAPSSEQN